MTIDPNSLRRPVAPGARPAWTDSRHQPGLLDGPRRVYAFGGTPETLIAAAYAQRVADDPNFKAFTSNELGVVFSALRWRSDDAVIAILTDEDYRDEIDYTRPATPTAQQPGEGALLANLDALRVRALDRVVDHLETDRGLTNADGGADACADLRDRILVRLGLLAEQ